MSKLGRGCLTLALCVALAGPAGGAGPDPGIAVSGGLFTAAGAPLAGARVELVPLSTSAQRGRLLAAGAVTLPPAATTRSDAEGHYRLDAPAAGLWRLVVRAPGSLTMVHDLVPLVEPTEVPPLTPPPDAGAVVRVVDPAGRPVTGARVRGWNRDDPVGAEAARPEDAGAGWLPLRTIVQTRQDGTARLPRAAGEALRFSAWAPAWVETVGEVGERGRGEEGVRLRDGVARTVVVLDPEGAAVAGASVVVGGPRGLQAGLTDGRGRLRVRLPEGEPVELVVAAGLRRGRVRLAPEVAGGDGGGGAPVPLHLPAAAPLTGRVVSRQDDAPLAGAVVWDGEAPEDWVRTGGDGRFELPVPQGRSAERPEMALRVAATGHLADRLRIRPAAEDGPLTLVLTARTGLTGRVVDTAGGPVAGAEIVAARLWKIGDTVLRSPDPVTAVSDGDGAFRVDGLIRGEAYDLRVRASGHAPAQRTVDTGAGSGDLRIVLQPGGLIRGRVVRATGAPAQGARVAVGPDIDPRIPGPRPREDEEVTATADDEGEFTVPDLAAGLYVVRIEEPGAAPLYRFGVEVGAGDRHDLGLLSLESGAVLEGRVLDADGAPVAQAQIEVRPTRLPGQRAGRARTFPATESGPDGRFRLAGLRRGEPLEVQVRAADGPEVRVGDVVLPTDAPLLVVLPRGATVFGRVVDESGAAVAEASVRAYSWREGGAGTTGRGTRSGEDGSFRVSGVSPGELKVHVAAEGYSSLMETYREELAPGERRGPLELVLPGGATLAGRVFRADGQPAVAVPVRVRYAAPGDGGRHTRTTGTDSSGTFRVELLPAAGVEVASDLGRGGRAEWKGELERGETWIELRAEPQLYVAGRITGAAGRPVEADVRVEAVGEGAPRLESTGDVVFEPGYGPLASNRTVSAPDGRFFLGDLPAGDYRLEARAPGYVPFVGDELLPVGPGPVDGVEVRLSRGAVVHGRLLGVEAEEIGDVWVRARSDDGRGEQRVGRVSADGGYRVEGLSPGRWRLSAHMVPTGRRAAGTLELAPGDEEVEVDLDLSRGLVVEGELQVAGRVPRHAVVALRPLEGGEAWAGAYEVRVPLLADGSFRAEGLVPRRYELSLSGGDLRTGPPFVLRLEVVSDRRVVRDFAAASVLGRVVDAVGAPLPDATVRLEPLSGLPPGQTGGVTRAGTDGVFAFLHVPPGRWRVEATTRQVGGTAEVLATAGTVGVEVVAR